jgi:DNA topoisomerase-2
MSSSKKRRQKKAEYDEKDTQVLSPYEHIRLKDKDTGPKEPKQIVFPLWDKDDAKFNWCEIEISVALITMLDEVLVNVGDHNTNYPDKVTDVDINFNIKTGEISVKNNGPGIPIYEVWISKDEKTGKMTPIKIEKMDPPMSHEDRKEHAKEIYWNPEVICTHTLAGTNLKKRSDHRTGGTNGIGLKCAVFQSAEFRLVTVDDNRKVKYEQIYEGKVDHLQINPPIIKEYGSSWDPSKHSSFTKMIFKPEYTLFGGEKYDESTHGTAIMGYLHMRACQLKTYTGMKVTFNGSLMPISGISEYAALHTEAARNEHERDLPKVAHCVMEYKGPQSDASKYNWEVAVVANLHPDARHVTLVNSIYPYEGGTHVDYLLGLLIPTLMDYLRKDLNKKEAEFKDLNRGGSLTKLIKSQICIFARCPINGPAFSGQIKARIMTPEKEFADRVFPASMIRAVWKIIEGYVKFHWFSKNDLAQSQTTIKDKKLDFDKYVPAINAGKKGKSHKTRLFIPEGDSAAQLIETGLYSKEVPDITVDNYGYFNVQGVPPNARRAYQRIINPETGEEFKIGTDKLLDNERFNALIRVLGLDFHKKYDQDEDADTLRYGGIILAVDQDEDGKGNIATLVVNTFSVFWPNLIKRGFIQILRTPIVTVRVKVSQKQCDAYQFYTLGDYEHWLSEEYPDGLPTGSNTKYHKGLACNSKDEQIRIMKNLEDNISTFTWDKKAEKTFEIYYGQDTSKRKKILSVPVDWSIVNEQDKEKKCSDVLNTDTRSFQQYNVRRKIPNVYDGMLDGRRKILTCAMDYFRVHSKTANVNAFGGAVKEAYDYAHGESSLNGSIIKMGQDFVGAMQIPVFKGNVISGFGSRKKGGKDHGAPRYLTTKLNHAPMELIFPRADKYLLKQSESGEPIHFVPIIPYAITQGDLHIPAHGWKVKSFAVDPIECIDIIQKIIKGKIDIDDTNEIPMLPISCIGWKGKIVCYKGTLYSVGTYEWDPKENKITITELPHGVFSNSYAFGDRKKEKRKKEKWKQKQKQQQSEKKKSTLEAEQLKAFRKSVKSKKHGAEFDDDRNDTDSEDDTSDSDSDAPKKKKKPKKKEDDTGERKEEYRSRTIKDKPFVTNVIDRTDNDVNIEIYLTDDGYKRIIEEYKKAQMEEPDSDDEQVDENEASDDEQERTIRYGGKTMKIPSGITMVDNFDAIEEFFLLRRSLTPQLNFLDEHGVVKHFNGYEEILATWYPERARLYTERVEREIILLKYGIIELENIIRYSKEYAELGMRDKSTEEVVEILEERKYVPLNTGLLHDPKYTKVDDLESLLTDENKVTFDYLIDLRFRDTQLGSIKRNQEKLERLLTEYKALIKDTKEHNKLFTGAKTWLAELDSLRTVLKQGFKHGWGFDEPRDNFISGSTGKKVKDRTKSKSKRKSKNKSKQEDDSDDDKPKSKKNKGKSKKKGKKK